MGGNRGISPMSRMRGGSCIRTCSRTPWSRRPALFRLHRLDNLEKLLLREGRANSTESAEFPGESQWIWTAVRSSAGHGDDLCVWRVLENLPDEFATRRATGGQNIDKDNVGRVLLVCPKTNFRIGSVCHLMTYILQRVA